MQALVEVVLPVFLVIGIGYITAWRKIMSANAIDSLLTFAHKIAIPCLLFRAISTLDLGQAFDLQLLFSYYTAALAGFALGLLGARYIFNRPWTDSVAIGFIGLFSNTLLLGLPITERAYGTEALAANYSIIAVHSPFCYGVGITAMEIARAQTRRPFAMAKAVGTAMFSNALVIGIGLGFIVNLGGIVMPAPIADGLDLMVRAALPAALFGMGGVLLRYRPEGDLATIAMACLIALVLQPLMTWALAGSFDLTHGQTRSAVITAAMAPGVNAYIFADMYGVGRRVAASAVLIGTALSVITSWGWLYILG